MCFTYWLDGNNVEAAKWYRRAAEQGNLLAQADLADMYKEGKGAPQDYAEAAKWYRRAAENDTVEKTPMIPSNEGHEPESIGNVLRKGIGRAARLR